MRKHVLIVGAGIAGQTLACALVRRGIAPDMVELKPDWNILGAGMYVQNNALRGFAEIGIADEIIASGWRSPTGASVVADRGGEVLARTVVPPCPGSDFPGYVPIARPALHDILHAATERAGVRVKMGVTVDALAQDAGSARVSFSDGTTGEYDLVVGADGINSKTRALTFAHVTPAYSGFSNWRAILPMTTPRNEVLWQVGLERSFGIIPISNTQLYIAGVSKEPGNPRFDHRDLLPLMQERFADFGGPAREMMSLVTESSQIVYTPIHEIIMPMPWSKERVVLIGDAAHASTPFWAQGASMAVEDAIVLARLVAERDDIMALLAEWERRRYPRCAFVQEGSKNTGVRGHAPGEDAYRRSLEHIRLHAQHDIDARYARLNEPI